MATKYVQEYASEADFLADAVDAPSRCGVAAVGEKLFINKGGSAIEVIDETATQTLTNKTLTSPTINGAVGTTPVVVPTVSVVLTAAQSGSVFILTAVADMILTLPAPAAGLEYEFWSAGAALTTSHYVVTDTAAAIIYGSVVVAGALVAASAEKRVNFIAASVLPGDRARLFSDGTSWFVEGDATAAGGITVTAP